MCRTARSATIRTDNMKPEFSASFDRALRYEIKRFSIKRVIKIVDHAESLRVRSAAVFVSEFRDVLMFFDLAGAAEFRSARQVGSANKLIIKSFNLCHKYWDLRRNNLLLLQFDDLQNFCTLQLSDGAPALVKNG